MKNMDKKPNKINENRKNVFFFSKILANKKVAYILVIMYHSNVNLCIEEVSFCNEGGASLYVEKYNPKGDFK